MKIGELAAATGASIESIRYYEHERLLPPPHRTAGNYRDYGEAHLQRVLFIRNCRALDLSLRDIRDLLASRDAPASDCRSVDDLLDAHIAQVQARAKDLRLLEQRLRALRSQCPTDSTDGRCGILQAMQSGGDVVHPSAPPHRRAPHK